MLFLLVMCISTLSTNAVQQPLNLNDTLVAQGAETHHFSEANTSPFFSKQILEPMLSQAGMQGLRIYPVQKDTFVLVSMDDRGRDLGTAWVLTTHEAQAPLAATTTQLKAIEDHIDNLSQLIDDIPAFLFSRDQIDHLLAQEGAQGIRFNPGTTDLVATSMTLKPLLVAVDSGGNNMPTDPPAPGIPTDPDRYCPPFCPA